MQSNQLQNGTRSGGRRAPRALCRRFVERVARATALCCGAVLMGSGCHAAPVAFRAEQLDTEAERKQFAPEYWNRFGLPAELDLTGTRVVISEFIVEYVTQKRESGGVLTKRQTVVNVPAGLVGVGLEASGINRKVIEYGPDLPDELTGELYAAFESVLRERGCSVISPTTVRESEAYQQFPERNENATSFLQRLNPIASDTGRVLKAEFRSAKGLKLLAGEDPTVIERTEWALLRELEADVSIRACFRLGVFDGRLSLDRGAYLLVDGPQLAGTLTSTRSLLSEVEVVVGREFFPVVGEVIAVDGETFQATALELFPHFVAMGLDKSAGDDLPQQ